MRTVEANQLCSVVGGGTRIEISKAFGVVVFPGTQLETLFLWGQGVGQ